MSGKTDSFLETCMDKITAAKITLFRLVQDSMCDGVILYMSISKVLVKNMLVGCDHCQNLELANFCQFLSHQNLEIFLINKIDSSVTWALLNNNNNNCYKTGLPSWPNPQFMLTLCWPGLWTGFEKWASIWPVQIYKAAYEKYNDFL